MPTDRSGERVARGNQLTGRRPVPRRRFLELMAAAGAGALAVPLLGGERAGPSAFAGVSLPPGYTASYPEGVMAGDPRPDGSVIWTRLARPAGTPPLPVLWEVATDAAFTEIAAGGGEVATTDRNWTVHVPVDGLGADRWYHYRFTVGGVPSPSGRLRTAPKPGTAPDRLRFAYASCQQRGTTYAAHRAISEEPDLDFFMHLGDYVYVSDGGTLTVDDYRGVYATFKANPLLQLVQQTVPLVAMFDDGEFYNGIDSTGDPARLAAAHQAWFETMPIIGPDVDPMQAYRSFGWGNLAEIMMLDVRSYRDPAVEATDTTTAEGEVVFDPDRTTLGSVQRAWLLDRLSMTPARWKLLGNPYNMAMGRVVDLDPGPPRPPGVRPGEGVYFPNEAWDDYQHERRQILEHLRHNQIPDVISCSGHTHVWIASEMSADPDDPDQPVVAFDFTTGSLTADPDLVRNEPDPVAALANYLSVAQYGATINPWIRFLNFIQFGYTVVTVEPCATTIDYRGIDVYDESAQPSTLARFRIHHEATSMETQYFETPCWSLPDPESNPVPPFAVGTGITDPVACPDLPVTTTTTTTTTPSAPPTTNGQAVDPTTAGVTTTLPPSSPAPPQPGSPTFVG